MIYLHAYNTTLAFQDPDHMLKLFGVPFYVIW